MSEGPAARSVVPGIWVRHGATILLVALLVLLAIPKVVLSAANRSPGIDGGYYTDIAASVRDGHGLRTDISLLHKGYPHFPHETDIYPLWPLLYGGVAKLFPLVPTGIWLATTLYFAALVAAYAWAVRVWPGPIFARVPLNAGHVAVLAMGLAKSFFEMTSLPYTEGIAFSLLFLALWRAHAILPLRTLRGGLELGAWAGLLVLARTQLVLFFAALACALLVALVAAPERRRTFVFGVAAAAGFAVLLAPEYLFLRSFIPGATPLDLFRFEKTQFGGHLAPFQVIKPAAGIGGFLADRAGGFLVAFAPTKQGYWSQFYVLAYAPFVALAALATRLGRDSLRRLVAWVREPSSLPFVFLVIFTTGAFLSIHTMHKAPDAWYFHRRHALTSAFLFIAAVAYLLRGAPWMRWTGLAFVVVGAALGVRQAARSIATPSVAQAAERTARPAPVLVAWIEQQKKRDPRLVLALRQPQLVAWQTDGVGYHWFDGSMPAENFVKLADELGLDAIVLPTSQRATARNPKFRKRFERWTTVGKNDVYRPRGRDGRDVEPPAPSAPDEPDEPNDPIPNAPDDDGPNEE